MVVQTLVYLFYVFVAQVRPLFEGTWRSGPGMLHGELWQPLTALFVHLKR